MNTTIHETIIICNLISFILFTNCDEKLDIINNYDTFLHYYYTIIYFSTFKRDGHLHSLQNVRYWGLFYNLISLEKLKRCFTFRNNIRK